jgi:hypothetical protein
MIADSQDILRRVNKTFEAFYGRVMRGEKAELEGGDVGSAETLTSSRRPAPSGKELDERNR